MTIMEVRFGGGKKVIIETRMFFSKVRHLAPKGSWEGVIRDAVTDPKVGQTLRLSYYPMDSEGIVREEDAYYESEAIIKGIRVFRRIGPFKWLIREE